MNAAFFLLPLAVVLLLAMPLVPIYKGVTTGRRAKHAVIFNLCAFFGVAALMVLLPVLANTPSDVAVSYAQDVLKACGNETAVQDFSYEPASFPDEELYYGSYFDSHDAIIRVFPFDSEDDESTYIVNDTMKAGEQRPVTALK